VPPLALEMLTALPRLGEYVFTTTGDRPISGFSRAKERLDQFVAAARQKDGEAELEAWTIHDLRRTVATGLGKLGVLRFVIERVLNHADRSVTGIYDRYEYLNEKRRGLEAWAAHLDRILNPPGENVVPLAPRAAG
jgi:integrase